MLIIVVLVHLFLFVSMFIIKNVVLTKKSKKSIRGKNKEAVFSIFFMVILFELIWTVIFILGKDFLPTLFINDNPVEFKFESSSIRNNHLILI